MKQKDIFKLLKILVVMSVFVLGFAIILGIISILNFKESNNSQKSYSLEDNDVVKYVKGDGLLVKGDNTVKLYDTKTNKIEELELEDYIKGVVSAEMPANFSEEAIKAQAVAARTYYFSKRLEPCTNAKGAEICNSTHCQVYMSKEDRIKDWGASSGEANWEKISKAVDETKDEVLIYNEDLVRYPQFFSTSSGKTENSIDVLATNVPYLQSVDSPGEEEAGKYKTSVDMDISKVVSKLNSIYKTANLTEKNAAEEISILSHTEGGAVKEIKIGNEIITGVKFRSIFGLNSANFTLKFSSNKVHIDCKGYGHGVGMSQWGANAMAKQGKDYKEILKHYYTGVDIDKVKYECK